MKNITGLPFERCRFVGCCPLHSLLVPLLIIRENSSHHIGLSDNTMLVHPATIVMIEVAIVEGHQIVLRKIRRIRFRPRPFPAALRIPQ
ncbi:hypothetical protein D3C77_555380 [compost metagenome]